jgi:hypothetical protein
LERIGVEELGGVWGDDERVEARARELRDEMFDRREPWKKSANLHVM